MPRGVRGTYRPEDFWSRVDRSGGPDACWPWMGGHRTAGYGAVRWVIDGVIDNHTAHAVAFWLTHGWRPCRANGQVVRHGCDNPPCCNPAHLEPGTQGDNNRDRKVRGRQHRGERTGNAALTDEFVREARRRVGEGASTRSVALAMGVHPMTLGHVIRGETWVHVT